MKTFYDHGIEVRSGSGNVKAHCPSCSRTRRKSRDKCLSVNLDEKVWNCHHCGWKGSLPKETPAYIRKPRKEFSKPAQPKAEGISQKFLDWFASRGISPEVLKRNKITTGKQYFPQLEKETDAILFPCYRGDDLVNVKYRGPDKAFRMEKGAERIFWGLPDVSSTTVIVEGELDKLAIEMAGLKNCISVPDGAPSPSSGNYESKFTFLDEPCLEDVETFILAVDNDAAGKVLEAELSRRLGVEQCERVEWPEGCKDANDVLLNHGADALASCLINSKPYPVKGVYSPSDFSSRVLSRYERGQDKGESTGWRTLDELYTVRPGEWTLFVGQPGHGKSNFLDALALNLANKGWRFGVCSPENQPIDRHLVALIEKHQRAPFHDGPRQRMSKGEVSSSLEWLEEHFKFILLEDDQTVDNILSLARVLVRREGIRGLIIYPWNELDHSRPSSLTETEYISQSLSKIRQFARMNDVHVWVVVHPTKLQKDKDGNYPVPTPYDASGSAHWRNKADNALSIWRDYSSLHDEVEIHVQKIRFRDVGKVGMCSLVYDHVCGGYTEPNQSLKVVNVPSERRDLL